MELISANAATWERKLLNGRPHWVGPASMIVPGVLNGSKGPLLYPADEIIRSVPAWNGMPITNGHPKDASGNYTSARQPEILDKYQLGQVFAANYDGRLNAEAWLDEALVAKKLPEVLNAIKAGKAIELSTGLGTEDEEKPGVYNGKSGQRSYTHIARNYQPDHLAILVGQKGACSLADGCGLGVNKGMCPECGEGADGCECDRSDPDVFKDPKDVADNFSLTGTGKADEPLKYNLLARAFQTLVNAFKPNQPRSEVTGRIKHMNAGQGKGECHEAAQEGYYSSVGGHTKPGTVLNYIREEDGKFCVYSESGEKLGEHATKAEAEAQLQAIEASKHATNERDGVGNSNDLEVDMNRREKVALLVNCACGTWKGMDAVLNDAKIFSDAKLDELVKQLKANEANVLVVNSLREKFGDHLTVNAMPAFIKEKIDAKAEDPDAEDDSEDTRKKEMPAMNQQQFDALLKANLGYDSATIIAGMAYATNAEKHRRKELVEKLVANASTPEHKKIMSGIFSKLPLEQLEALASTIPVVRNREEQERQYNYPSQFIGNGGFVSNAWEEYTDADLPPEPGSRKYQAA